MWLAFGALTRELRDGEIVVGSGADADWRVPTADLMPRHFTLVVHGLNASLKPASRDVVVVVNDRQLVAQHLLNEGDVIRAGGGWFRFTDGEPDLGAPGPAEADPAYLIDEHRGIAHFLHSRSTTIGRDSSNRIVLRDPSASRFHAEVRREAGGYALHSMGAAGTLLNGAKVKTPTMLAEGDRIEVAPMALRFSMTAPDDSAEALASVTAEMQRYPTLATGQMSVVPRRSRGWMLWVVVAIAAAALAAGALHRWN